jgi:hypothetical protein
MCDAVSWVNAQGRVVESKNTKWAPNLCEDARIFLLACETLLGSDATVARSEKRAAPVKLKYYREVYCVTNKSRNGKPEPRWHNLI